MSFVDVVVLVLLSGSPYLPFSLSLLPTNVLLLLASFSIQAMSGAAISTGAADAFVCVVSGTVGGLIIGLVTEYYTSFSYAPVREVSWENASSTWLVVFLGLAWFRAGLDWFGFAWLGFNFNRPS